MISDRHGPPHPLRSLARVAACAVALAVARNAAGADAWNGRATIGYGGVSAPGTSSRALQQGYEGSLRLAFTPAIDSQFQLRYDDTRSTTAGTAQLVRPAAGLHYRASSFDLKLGYDLAYARSASSQSAEPSQRLSDNLQLVTSFSPADLPSARLSVSRQTNRALESPGEIRNTSGLLTLDYGFANIRVNQSTLASLVENTGSEVTSRTIQPRASVAFERKLGASATVSGSYNVAYTEVAQTSIASQPVLSPAEHFPSGTGGGIYGVAPVAVTGSLGPLLALTDGDTSSPIAGIPLGPSAVSNENIGIDMGRLVTIDTLELWVRTAAGTILPASQYDANQAFWSVYASVDGTSWTAVGSAPPVYNASDGRLEWTQFTATLARYFKVVSATAPSGFPTADAYPTEIRAIEHVLVQPGATARSSTFVQGGAFAASVKPLEKLSLTGQTSLTRSSQTTPVTVFSTTGWSVGGNASAGPFQDNRLTTTVAEEVRGSDATLGGRRLGTATSASVRYLVMDPLNLSVDADRTEEGGVADRVESYGARLGTAVTLLPSTLAFSASVGFDRVHTQPDDVETDRLSTAITSSARVFPSLTLTGAASLQTGEVKQPASAVLLFPQPPAAKIYSGGATYRPNERLSLGASLSYVDLPLVAGLAQQYRVAWDPFPGGSLKLGLSYDQTFDASTGSRVSRLGVMPTWQLNRSASLSGTYSDTLHASPAPRAHMRLYFLAFTMRV